MTKRHKSPHIPQDSRIQRTLLVLLRHELCTPINAIVGYSEMLLDELKSQQDSPMFSDLQQIHACGTQLLTLTNVILDPAQLEMSQFDWNIDSFGSTIRLELITPLSTAIGYCEILLEEAATELIPDLDRINAAAQHLLSMIDDIVNLAFQQLHVIDANDLSTSCLMLESPTARALVQNAATTIHALSEEKPWAAVAVGGTLLVVDDNETNCDLLSRQLERQGYTVATATNGPLALQMVQTMPFDLILLDIIMPAMNGFEVLEQLKSHADWRHIPVIVLSALDEIESIVKCIEIGAEDYLYKPFNPTLLKARISAHLEKKQLRDQEMLYLQQVERLTTAAVEVEAKTFDPESLADLARRTDKLGQLALVFQRMASEVNTREQRLEQQVQILQVAINQAQKKRIVTEIAETDHFKQLQKRAMGRGGHWHAGVSSPFPPAPEKTPILPWSEIASLLPVPKIVSVHSYRGGTGKSNLTSNLAASIASQGQRVGIVDTDIQSPGIHVLFGLDEEKIDRTLNDYLWGRCAIREAAYDVSHVLLKRQHPSTVGGSIYLIPSSVNTNNITRILREGYDEEMLIDGFQELIRDLQLDYLFIDTHPGVNEETLRALTVSNLLIMILRPDYQDYQGTAVTVELARMLAVSKMLLVVNKALPIFEPSAYRQQLEAAYNVSVAEILPLCEEMVDLASSDIFCLRYPTHPWAEAVRAIAKRIIS